LAEKAVARATSKLDAWAAMALTCDRDGVSDGDDNDGDGDDCDGDGDCNFFGSMMVRAT
jgi:hypothetical protein